jgi:UDP-N-acetylmuramate dehydrogenase
MEILEHVSLKPLHTFQMDVEARYFATFNSVEQLQAILKEPNMKHQRLLVLGGGSNILFVKDFDGLVLKNEIKGISKLDEDYEHIYVEVGAGENWHAFVEYTMQQNWAGLENLSLIPGNVGASPMQNIGAYGV